LGWTPEGQEPNLGDEQNFLYLAVDLLKKCRAKIDNFPFRMHRLISLFDNQAASAKRHLRTFTYISYALYPLGIVIGLLGQLAGVKPPGGE